MWKKRISALMLIVASFLVAYFVYDKPGTETKFPYVLGLDLSGGSHLVFNAKVSDLPKSEIEGAMNALANVVERRINLFGVSEPVVQVEKGGLVEDEYRLIVELPGVTDVNKAVALIGATPVLDFRLMKDGVEKLTPAQQASSTVDDIFKTSGLTGRYLKRATLQFDRNTYEPHVGIEWNSEGKELFAKITRENTGKVLAIFLDGVLISTPVIQQEIVSGEAVISGKFKLDEAKKLVRDLNYGALPVPVELVSTQTVGASLGDDALFASLKAGIWAFLAIAIFLVIWYRLPGFISVIALGIYVVLNLAMFKLIPVTLTSAGIAGFILTLGMAVDANILIFERMREELRSGKALPEAMKEGFHRAWLSIRDSNLSSIITAIVLYYFASTPVIKGFALVFFIGVVVSMFTAITASRTMLFAITSSKNNKFIRFLFSSGIKA